MSLSYLACFVHESCFVLYDKYVILSLLLFVGQTNLCSYVTIGHNWCQDAGIYEFTMGATGDKVKGRYSFVYVWEDGEWKISHHHSSVMPEAFLGPSPKPAMKEEPAKEVVSA